MLPARVAGYRPEWLDDLCLSGEVAWGRFTARAAKAPAMPRARRRRGRGGAVPSRATPITLRAPRRPRLAARARRAATRGRRAPGDGAARESSRRCARAARCSTPSSSPHRAPPRRGRGGALGPGRARARHRRRLRQRARAADRPRALGQARGASARRAASPRRPRDRGGRGGPLGDLLSPSLLDAERGADARPSPRRSPSSCSRAGASCSAISRARDARAPLARDPLGAAPAGGARHRARRPLRDRLRRRAVRAARRRRRAAPDCGAASARARSCASPPCDPLNLAGILTPGPRVPALRGNAVTYRDGLPIAEHSGPVTAVSVRA